MKRKILRIAACIAAMSASLVMAAENSEPFNFYSLTTPSAESFSMSRYGGIMSSLYTGAMNHSVPLFTYSDPDFTLPVSLDYHFDGFRPAMYSGTVGYGWSLDCGGVITRKIRGFPDELRDADNNLWGYFRYAESGFASNSLRIIANTKAQQFAPVMASPYIVENLNVFTDEPAYTTLSSLGGGYDTNADIFHFSFGEHSGDFIMMEDGTFKVFNTERPYGEYSVSVDCSMRFTYGMDAQVCEFTVTTGDGYSYVFGGDMPSTEHSVCEYGSSCSTTISAWKLREIIAPNGRTVTFNYMHRKQHSITTAMQYSPVFAAVVNASGFQYSSQSSNSVKRTSVCSNVWSPLESVSVDGHTVMVCGYEEKAVNECAPTMFDGVIEMSDEIILPNIFRYHDTVNNDDFRKRSPLRLSGIVFKNINGATVEKCTLEQTLLYGRYFLETASTGKAGKYRFGYCSASSSYVPSVNTDKTDHWGYYNGVPTPDIRAEISSLMIQSGSLYAMLGIESLQPDAARTMYGALTSITYPTGGRTEIEYEGNTAGFFFERDRGHLPYFKENSDGYGAGGVRVKSITDIPAAADSSRTLFLYRQSRSDQSSSGVVFDTKGYVISAHYYYRTNLTFFDDTPGTCSFECAARGYTNECSLQYGSDAHVGYENVIVVHPDSSSTEYKFAGAIHTIDIYIYDDEFITEVEKNFTDAFDAVYSFDENYTLELYRLMLPPVEDRSNFRSKLIRKTEYDCGGAVRRMSLFEYGKSLVYETETVYNMLINFVSLTELGYQCLLESEEVREYDGDSFTAIETDYDYNDLGQVSRRTVHTDDGSIRIRTDEYCHEQDTHAESGLGTLKSSLFRRVEMAGAESSSDFETVSSTRYAYSGGNPSPVSATETRSGESRTITVTYDSNLRPTRVDYPGGRYTEYVWNSDGRHLLRSTSNIPGNTTVYQWKDLVGLTWISMPTGLSEQYIYDSKGRLDSRYDPDGCITVKYRYHLNHEQ